MIISLLQYLWNLINRLRIRLSILIPSFDILFLWKKVTVTLRYLLLPMALFLNTWLTEFYVAEDLVVGAELVALAPNVLNCWSGSLGLLLRLIVSCSVTVLASNYAVVGAVVVVGGGHLVATFSLLDLQVCVSIKDPDWRLLKCWLQLVGILALNVHHPLYFLAFLDTIHATAQHWL